MTILIIVIIIIVIISVGLFVDHLKKSMSEYENLEKLGEKANAKKIYDPKLLHKKFQFTPFHDINFTKDEKVQKEQLARDLEKANIKALTKMLDGRLQMGKVIWDYPIDDSNNNVSPFIKISYEDNYGDLSEREVTLLFVSKNERGVVFLHGYCHSAKDARTFRLERIGQIIDPETGAELIKVDYMKSLGIEFNSRMIGILNKTKK